jgi:hypothetical protein
MSQIVGYLLVLRLHQRDVRHLLVLLQQPWLAMSGAHA